MKSNKAKTNSSFFRFFSILSISIFMFGCSQNEVADMIIYAADVQTVDSTMTSVEAVAVLDGKILKAGSQEDISNFVGPNTTILDFPDAFVMPGFIEGHGHFSGLGSSLSNLNFLKSKSWQDIVSQVEEKVKETEPGEWIYGRGWHQEKWVKSPEDAVGFYPTHQSLSEISPDNPVLLVHASGHSLFANQSAMQLAGVGKEMPDPKGGHIVRDSEGLAIGVFEERGMNTNTHNHTPFKRKSIFNIDFPFFPIFFKTHTFFLIALFLLVVFVSIMEMFIFFFVSLITLTTELYIKSNWPTWKNGHLFYQKNT